MNLRFPRAPSLYKENNNFKYDTYTIYDEKYVKGYDKKKSKTLKQSIKKNKTKQKQIKA